MDKSILKRSNSKTLSNLWQEEEFIDVTLATYDGRQIKAHKAILCSASKFFRNIMVGNPVVYFKVVSYRELESLVKFTNFGEVELDEDQLPKFLVLALELEVEGLRKGEGMSDKGEGTSDKGEGTQTKVKARLAHSCAIFLFYLGGEI